MTTQPLPQTIKTQLAQLAVFPDQLSNAQLACKLRGLAREIEFGSPVPKSKLFRKIQKFYADFYDGELDSMLDLAANLEELASFAWKEFDESYQAAVKIL